MKHPETLLGPNPLIEPFAPYVPLSVLPKEMWNEPLTNVPWWEVAPEYRIPLLPAQYEHFFPTAESVAIAFALQEGMRASITRRNPLKSKEQRRINQLALITGEEDRPTLQALANPASGGIISAETGEGKTTIVRRAFDIFAPQQVVVHDRSEVCGWSRLTQICHLHVDLPFNGSRGGLMARIVGGVDALLGSDYGDKLRKIKNLDAQVVFVMKVLSMHRVGALALDEGQPDNFDECAWQREFVLFFLAVMNYGIPIVLCGHPRAFTNLQTAGQVMRRFSDIGFHELHRAVDATDKSWSEAYAPGIMRFNLCETIEEPEKIIDCSFEETGGARGLFAARWLETQRIALLKPGSKATVTVEDFIQSRYSPHCSELYRMARWMNGHAPDGPAFDDISSVSSAPDTTDIGGRSPPDADLARAKAGDNRVPRAVLQLIQGEERRAKERERKASKNAELLKNTAPEDLRTSERVIEIMAGLDASQRNLLTV